MDSLPLARAGPGSNAQVTPLLPACVALSSASALRSPSSR